jgi:hypothetical protein
MAGAVASLRPSFARLNWPSRIRCISSTPDTVVAALLALRSVDHAVVRRHTDKVQQPIPGPTTFFGLSDLRSTLGRKPSPTFSNSGFIRLTILSRLRRRRAGTESHKDALPREQACPRRLHPPRVYGAPSRRTG